MLRCQLKDILDACIVDFEGQGWVAFPHSCTGTSMQELLLQTLSTGSAK